MKTKSFTSNSSNNGSDNLFSLLVIVDKRGNEKTIKDEPGQSKDGENASNNRQDIKSNKELTQLLFIIHKFRKLL